MEMKVGGKERVDVWKQSEEGEERVGVGKYRVDGGKKRVGVGK